MFRCSSWFAEIMYKGQNCIIVETVIDKAVHHTILLFVLLVQAVRHVHRGKREGERECTKWASMSAASPHLKALKKALKRAFYQASMQRDRQLSTALINSALHLEFNVRKRFLHIPR